MIIQLLKPMYIVLVNGEKKNSIMQFVYRVVGVIKAL